MGNELQERKKPLQDKCPTKVQSDLDIWRKRKRSEFEVRKGLAASESR